MDKVEKAMANLREKINLATKNGSWREEETTPIPKVQAYMFFGPVQKWSNTAMLWYKPKKIHIWFVKKFFGFSIVMVDEYERLCKEWNKQD